MGIATTASAALIAAFTGADPAHVTGRGTGIDDAMLAHKTDVVRAALARRAPGPADPPDQPDPLALPAVQAAAAVLTSMATFDSAGVPAK